MPYYGWKPYVPVAERRKKAAKVMAKLSKGGRELAPVRIEGRGIATTFWGKAWNQNLEAYSDYSNRLPRGRTYVRNGSVLDLQIGPGEVRALVSGSEIYDIKILVQPVATAAWASIRQDCAGGIESLVELLQGRLSKGVMERICRQQTGLFPSPKEIRLSCSCPDGASMCKHVAAVLYGVGARLDHQPGLLFTLRQVEVRDLLASAGKGMALSKAGSDRAKVLEEESIADLFDLEMADTPLSKAASAADRPPAAKSSKQAKGKAPAKAAAHPIAKIPAKTTVKLPAKAVPKAKAMARAKPSKPAAIKPRKATSKPGKTPARPKPAAAGPAKPDAKPSVAMKTVRKKPASKRKPCRGNIA